MWCKPAAATNISTTTTKTKYTPLLWSLGLGDANITNKHYKALGQRVAYASFFPAWIAIFFCHPEQRWFNLAITTKRDWSRTNGWITKPSFLSLSSAWIDIFLTIWNSFLVPGSTRLQTVGSSVSQSVCIHNSSIFCNSYVSVNSL